MPSRCAARVWLPPHASSASTIRRRSSDSTSACSELVAPAGTKPELTAVGAGREPLTYAWYSSVGDLTGYRQPSAVLDAAEAAEGAILLVVRDGAGGVGWHLLPARVD